MSQEWIKKYLTMKPEVNKIFDDLEAYQDFCRFELCEFNPSHLYDKSNVNYRRFLDSQRFRKDFRRDNRSRQYNSRHHDEQSFSS